MKDRDTGDQDAPEGPPLSGDARDGREESSASEEDGAALELGRLVEEELGALIDPKEADGLASQLVWRLGRLDDGPVTVRVGFATSAQLFASLPRLKNASDHEVELAIKERALCVEWVGPL